MYYVVWHKLLLLFINKLNDNINIIWHTVKPVIKGHKEKCHYMTGVSSLQIPLNEDDRTSFRENVMWSQRVLSSECPLKTCLTVYVQFSGKAMLTKLKMRFSKSYQPARQKKTQSKGQHKVEFFIQCFMYCHTYLHITKFK